MSMEGILPKSVLVALPRSPVIGYKPVHDDAVLGFRASSSPCPCATHQTEVWAAAGSVLASWYSPRGELLEKGRDTAIQPFIGVGLGLVTGTILLSHLSPALDRKSTRLNS